MSASVSRAAIVIAPPSNDVKVTGLTLAERGRRVAIRAGVPAADVHLVTTPMDIPRARAAAAGKALLLLNASGHVVAAPLVEPLEPDQPGNRLAFDEAGTWAGALVCDADRAGDVWSALSGDPQSGDAALAQTWRAAGSAGGVDTRTVGRRARCPARTPDEVRAADAWQFELVNKPLDSFLTVYFYRPLARPLTRVFLNTPFTPNQISIFSVILSLVGCFIAAGASYQAHVIGLALLVAGGIVDCNDGEVARLRLEGSTLGAWLDAIGDDLARLGMLTGIGLHVAHRHADLPIGWLTGAALAMTLATLVLIYWYCIFVIQSSNNQDYTAALGVGPGQAVEGDKRKWTRVAADWAAQIVRRDFMDIAVLVLALVDLPEIGFVGLVAGAAIGLGVVIPTHLKIVRALRSGALVARRA